MVPDIAKKGRSFKGAFAYYLHDKGPEGAAKPTTAARVAWTETRNLATDGPQTAARIMIATAAQADELKASAGIKATGRKSTQAVYAYSLAWHPDEAATLDRAEMVRAVDASLIVLGADHLQAVIVCHTDQKHPHVHVIVNRVDPATGKMHTFGNDFHKLDAWAHAYEEARGRIVTPERAAKHERIRTQRATPAFQKAQEPPKPVPAPITRPKSAGAALAELSAELRAKHAKQWDSIKAANKERRAAAWADRPNFKAIAAQHRAETKPAWSAFGKEQAKERRAFAQQERTLAGRLAGSITAAHARGLSLGTKGFAAAVLSGTFNSHLRAAHLVKSQAQAKNAFSLMMERRLDVCIEAAKRDHGAKMAHVARQFDQERAALKARQDLERGKVSAAWKEIYAAKERAAAGRAAAEAKRREEVTARRSAIADRAPPIQQRLPEHKAPAPVLRNKAADRPPPSPVAQEKPRMKDAFENTTPRVVTFEEQMRAAAQRAIAKQITQTVSVPAPAPSPSGAPPAPKQAQPVPKVDKVQDWARTPEGQRVTAQQAQKVAPANLRPQTPEAYRPPATPAKPTPAPVPATPSAPVVQKTVEPSKPVPAAPTRIEPPKTPARENWVVASTPPEPPNPEPVRDIWSDAAQPSPSSKAEERERSIWDEPDPPRDRPESDRRDRDRDFDRDR